MVVASSPTVSALNFQAGHALLRPQALVFAAWAHGELFETWWRAFLLVATEPSSAMWLPQ